MLPRTGSENPQRHRASGGTAIVRAPIGPKNSRPTTLSPQDGQTVSRYPDPGELKR